MALPYFVLFFAMTLAIMFGCGFIGAHASRQRWRKLQGLIAITGFVWIFGVVGLATAATQFPGIAWLMTFTLGLLAFAFGIGRESVVSTRRQQSKFQPTTTEG